MELKFNLKIFLIVSGSVLFLNALSWLIIWKMFPLSAVPYAVHYSVLSGADIFGTTNTLFVLPFLGAIITGINMIIALLLRKKEVFLSYIFLVMSFIIQVLLFIAIAALLRFNGLI